MSSPDTPTREPMDEKKVGQLTALLLAAYRQGGNAPTRFDFRGEAERFLAALPPARPAEPTGDMRGKIVAALEAADGWNPDAVSDDPRAHRAMVQEYERIADVVMWHLWPSDSAPFATPFSVGKLTSEAAELVREAKQIAEASGKMRNIDVLLTAALNKMESAQSDGPEE